MDQLLEDSLLKKTNDSIAVLTLGYCRLGRNLSLVLLKDLLKHKNPKTLVLEVREDENRYSHPVFPYLAEREDVFQPVMLFNPDLIKDLYLGVRTRFEYHQRKWLNNHPEAYPADYRSYGYGSSQRLADSTFLRQKKAERIIRAERKLKEGGRDFHMRFPRAYLKKIAQLVATHGIQLYFLYLPEYGWPLREPMELATYRQYGEVWIPPADILDNPKHWMDDGHLNDEGARALSGWLVSLLQGN
ncbi:MAG: hypothetical protein DHS20C18_11920 [Saprospiraceae bacterium]|nr:MAG: hypothetical protein DHS20C18_11920 [Saprospiraceae bacterium]